MRTKKLHQFGFALCLCTAMHISTSAQAGFSWERANPLPPPAPITVETDAMMKMPVASVIQEQLPAASAPAAPQTNTPMRSPISMPAPSMMMKAQPSADISTQRPAMPTGVMEVMPVQAGKNYDVIEGFGSDIPLALAMRQIIPAHYQFGFAPHVNMAQKVSWSGGKPWDQVLDDALAPAGLASRITENRVSIMTQIDKEAMMSAFTPVPAPVMPLETVMPMPQDENMPLPPLPSMQVLPGPAPDVVFDTPRDEAAAPHTQSYPRRQRPSRGPLSIFGIENESHDAPGTPDPLAPSPVIQPVHMGVAAPAPVIMPAQPAQAAQPMSLMPPTFVPKSPVPQAAAPDVRGGAAQAPVMDPLEIRFWQAGAGDSLQNVLNRWSAEGNVALLWQAQNDYRMGAPVTMHGTYSDAVVMALESFGQSALKPTAQLYPNLPNGPSVLVVRDTM